ncbi:MAG: glycosyltransferase [Eubacteriales bacterium]|nr:glycosyltransferase [Eubacteriales bacterium]
MANAVVFMNPVPSKAPQISCFKFLKVISPCFSQVSVISSSLDDTDDAKIINVKYKKQNNKIIRLINFFWFQLKVFFKALFTIKKGDYAFFWVGDKMFSSMLVCKLKRVKTYFFLYGMTSLENASKKAQTTKKSQEYLADKADYICVESPSVLTDRGRELTDKVKIIHLFVDDLGVLHNRENKVGMLCRLASGKCVLESIEGFAKFHQNFPDYTLHIVGDGILYDECKKLVRELSAESYITLHGWLLHDELFKIMPSWKLLLFPTKTEGMPNSVLESMSMGIPVLASPVGGIRDIILNYENGYVLEKDDCDSIAQALSEVMSSDTLQKVSQKAKATIDERFTLEKAQMNFKSQMGF